MDSEQITLEEIQAMFGPTMPTDAVLILSADISITEVRAQLQALAALPPTPPTWDAMERRERYARIIDPRAWQFHSLEVSASLKLADALIASDALTPPAGDVEGLRAKLTEQAAEIERLQNVVTAHVGALDGLQAYLEDRTISEPGSFTGESALRVLAGSRVRLAKDAEQITAARWSQYASLKAERDALAKRLCVREAQGWTLQGSIYDGFSTEIWADGAEPGKRTIAIVREYADALKILGALASQPDAEGGKI